MMMIYLQGVQGTVAKYDAIVEALEAKVRRRLIGWEFIGAGWKEFMTHCFSPDGYWMLFSEGIWDSYLDFFVESHWHLKESEYALLGRWNVPL